MKCHRRIGERASGAITRKLNATRPMRHRLHCPPCFVLFFFLFPFFLPCFSPFFLLPRRVGYVRRDFYFEFPRSAPTLAQTLAFIASSRVHTISKGCCARVKTLMSFFPVFLPCECKTETEKWAFDSIQKVILHAVCLREKERER